MRSIRKGRGVLVFCLAAMGALLGGAGGAALGLCGPFSDVTDATFCPFVLEIFTLGITTGTTPTTYDPASPVSRLQMAAFLSRTVDGVLTRGSRRAALGQFWTPQNTQSLGLTTVGAAPFFAASDGADVWVGNHSSGTVSRVRASDGKLLETWTGADHARAVLPVFGRVLVTEQPDSGSDGRLYRIDPSQSPGAVTTVTSDLGSSASLTFDGARLWAGHEALCSGVISIVTPTASLPWTVTHVSDPNFHCSSGSVFDGSNIWAGDGTGLSGWLLKLAPNGTVLQTVTLAYPPGRAAFDGTNIWVPTYLSVTVVRASTGAILATLTGNGMSGPYTAAFDGRRVLVTDFYSNSVSLWKAADLTPLGSTPTGGLTYSASSDGLNFWITMPGANLLVRF